MNTKTVLPFGILILAVVALLLFVRSQSEPREIVNINWPGTEVACLAFGHQNLAQHIHPELTITVDGIAEAISPNVGLTENCMAEVHTHDATGQIHIESVVHGKTFTLLDYFAVRGENIEREGYAYQVFVNGQFVDPTSYVLQDLDQVEVQYTSGE